MSWLTQSKARFVPRFANFKGSPMSIMKQSPPPPIDDNLWTLAELTTARIALDEEITRLRQTLAAIAVDLGSQALSLIDDAGDEVADISALVSELDANTLLVTNSIDVLAQCEKAVEHIAQLRYGECDMCEHPIGKARLKALPQATLCIQCQ